MKIRDVYALARQAARGNRLRANLTVAIITIGIFALISIITIIQILENNIEASFSTMGANTFSIRNQSLINKGRRHQGQQQSKNQTITYLQAKHFKKHYDYPAQVGISLLATNEASLKSASKSSNPNTNVLAVDEQYLPMSGIALVAGRNFTPSDALSGRNLCLAGYKIARNYYGNAQQAVDQKITIDNTPYRIIGVLDKTGSSLVDKTDNQLFVSLNNARQKFSIAHRSFTINVKIKDLKYMQLAQDAAIGQMRVTRKLKPQRENNFSIIGSDGMASILLNNVRIVSISAATIGFITLLGAAIGLMNIMLVAVAERTREIGVSKAIGADNNTIRRQFMTEAIYISLKGGGLGIILGILSGNLFSIYFESAFVVPWNWVTLGLVTCLAVGFTAGIYPAIKASKLNPINALRYE